MKIYDLDNKLILETDSETLKGENLSGKSLRKANLSGADLSGANLYRADLSGVNLSSVADLVRPVIT